MATLSLRLPSLEDGDPWVVHQKLFDVLKTFLQPGSNAAPSSAAKDIDDLTPGKRQADDGKPKEDYESFLLEIWNSIIEIAKQIPSDHASQDRLVELVKALSELPPIETEIWGSTVKVWADLPLLGPAMREAWIEPTSHNQAPTTEDAQRWINQNAFAARLLNLEQISWSNFAVWSLRSALEEKPGTAAQSHKCEVSAAAQWMLYCAPYLLEEAKGDAVREAQEANAEPQPNRGQPLAGGKLYKGKARLCPERWQFWKQQFEGITQPDIQSVASLAKQKMDSAE
ncbi:hypothetical protein MGYG_03787 [Nannizzia gypsea CBS 118893]|uniref:DUF3632 domain-containing protein n=1 Tax=Arthroderma gypseum (strain ATCC MYA-4604 / CBS 118893) TaxID=535722 RepID=E4UTX7_ARTGP|nr:hypothetical protein MGYG_03787 [Nannizzia gypsea CBS 118893]EFR00783.1 hypothetical protein MGYG_03787 [Nannizzia gypsea CBS 118893]